MMAPMEPMCNMRKGVTRNNASGIPTGVRDYCHLRATVVMIYKNICCFLLHFSTLTSLITHTGWQKCLCAPDNFIVINRCTETFRSPCITPFIIQDRLVARMGFHKKGKCGQQYKEIKTNFALYWYCFKAWQISTLVRLKSFTESEIPATTCHVTPLLLPPTISRVSPALRINQTLYMYHHCNEHNLLFSSCVTRYLYKHSNWLTSMPLH